VNQDVLLGTVVNGQSLNRFAFVNGNPVSYVDPDGQVPIVVVPFIVLGVIEGALSAYDIYNTVQTILDPEVSNVGKGIVACIFVVGMVLPGGGYSSLKFPGARHFIKKVTQKTVAKEKNTVIEPGVDVIGDVNAIRSGLATRVGETFVINGRTYGIHNGAIHPISGPGFHQLELPAFKALGVYNKFGNSQRAAEILNNIGISEAARNAALPAWQAIQ